MFDSQIKRSLSGVKGKEFNVMLMTFKSRFV